MSLAPHLELGYVSSAHGLAGEVAVKTFDPASQTLLDLKRVLLRTRDGKQRELVIKAVRGAAKEFLVTFKGIQGRVVAQTLVGSTVLAFREDLGSLDEGQFFQGDLVGMAAEDEQGRPLGVVVELWNTGEVPSLLIKGPNGEELMVPFVDEFVPQVDMDGRRLVVRPLEYLE